MIFLRKATLAVTVLLVLLMSTMLILPPGMDLEICFGQDGRIDFSLNGCQDGASPMVPARERPAFYDTAHYGECLDVVVACSATQQIIRSDWKSDTYSDKSTPKKDPSKTPFLFSELLSDSAGAYLDPNLYPTSFRDFPSPHLVSLRTVVLLI